MTRRSRRTRPLRVAVDATPLLDVRTGIGNFTAALLTDLGQRPDIDVTAFPISLRGFRSMRDAAPPGVRVRSGPLPSKHVREAWRRWDRPRIDPIVGRQDVVHGPNFVVPPSRAARLATVHDLTAVRYPEMCEADTLAYPALIRQALAHGAWIHTPSHAVRDEVVDTLGADPDRVVAVPNGHTPMSTGDAARGRVLAGCDDFVLAVGTVEPRKDLPGLVGAVDQLVGAGHDITLVHVGPDGWGAEALADAVSRLAHPERFIRLGRVADHELADLYRAARLFAYPSRYEGFGIPVLEAMSAGVPVVTTSVPAIAEVAGDAAVLVAPGDVDALAQAIGDVWTDEDRRRALISAGHQRAGEYTWERCVDGLVELYRRISDSGAS